MKRFIAALLCAALLAAMPLCAGAAGTDSSGFTDITPGAWYETPVRDMCARGYMAGVSGTSFNPSGTMTRAMFVTMLFHYAEAKTADYPGSSFDDVAEDAWYAPYVQWAYLNGVAAGTGDGSFSPALAISREEMASML